MKGNISKIAALFLTLSVSVGVLLTTAYAADATSANETTIQVNETAQLSCRYDAEGASWTTSNSAVAAITGTGVSSISVGTNFQGIYSCTVKGISEGTAIISLVNASGTTVSTMTIKVTPATASSSSSEAPSSPSMVSSSSATAPTSSIISSSNSVSSAPASAVSSEVPSAPVSSEVSSSVSSSNKSTSSSVVLSASRATESSYSSSTDTSSYDSDTSSTASNSTGTSSEIKNVNTGEAGNAIPASIFTALIAGVALVVFKKKK